MQNTIEVRIEEAPFFCCHRRAGTGCETGGYQDGYLAHDHPHHAVLPSPERDPDADLIPPPGDVVRHDAVESDARQQHKAQRAADRPAQPVARQTEQHVQVQHGGHEEDRQPPGKVLVAAGMLLGRVPDYLRGTVHIDRSVLALSDSWHAVGPALVLCLAGYESPAFGDWPLLAAALGAQIVFDALFGTLRGWLSLGVAPALQLRMLGWVFLVDLALSPVGLLVALVAVDQPAADLTPVNLRALNTYAGFYATDTFDITQRLSVTAGGRFNIAQIELQDLRAKGMRFRLLLRIDAVTGPNEKTQHQRKQQPHQSLNRGDRAFRVGVLRLPADARRDR